MNFGRCPIPHGDHPVVTLAHGGGDRLTRQLIERMFRRVHDNEWLREQHDGAVLPALPPGELPVFTTDSFVVSPLEFPGGDIGKLAVCGTVNDLAMCDAEPRYLSCTLVIEEGLPMTTLWRVITSMGAAARAAGVQVVTGDTKVVARGQADALFVNTAGLGSVPPGRAVRPSGLRDGDAVLLSGDVGRHGIAVLASRAGLEFEEPIESDCAPVIAAVRALFAAGVEVHTLRDLTRGGLATACVELASAELGFALDEAAIPVRAGVRGACELLGLDPLYVANEGRFLAVVPAAQADRALAALAAAVPADCAPARIGSVTSAAPGSVTLRAVSGGTRLLDMLSGEQLPRIC